MQHGIPEKLTCQGVQYDLGHLSPFVHRLPNKGHEGGDLAIRIRFESHVFSRAPSGDEAHDFIDENDKKRVFCEDRYTFSKSLPDQVRQMLECNSMSMQVQDKNGYYNLAVVTPASPILTSGVHDVLVYYMYPSELDGVHVEMRVKSCYNKYLNVKSGAKKDKILTYAKRSFFQKRRVPKPTGD